MNLTLSIITKVLHADVRPYAGALCRGRFPVTNGYVGFYPPPISYKSANYSHFHFWEYSLQHNRYCPKSRFGTAFFPYLYRYAHGILPTASVGYET